jgi:transcriptional regulator with XRE-family HTH domain
MDGAGSLLREWRERRRMSQLQLSATTGVSTRHLSYIETGRSRPSRELVLFLAEHLEVPLRDRNMLLQAAGYAPVYHQTPWMARGMADVRELVDRYLAAIEPFPAVVVDREWNIVTSNDGANLFLEGVHPDALLPVPNVWRIMLHPKGLASRIVDLSELAHHLITRLYRQQLLTGDECLGELLNELTSYPGVADRAEQRFVETTNEVALQFRLTSALGELRFLSAVTTFGTAVDVTLAELAVETFFPADEQTRRLLVRTP